MRQHRQRPATRPRTGSVSAPLLAALIGVLAIGALGVRLKLQQDHPPADPAGFVGIVAPAIDEPTQPAGNGRLARVVLSGGEAAWVYTPGRYNPDRGYPLVVVQPMYGVGAIPEGMLARWMPAADRNRWLLVLSESFRAKPREIVGEIGQWWYLDGPATEVGATDDPAAVRIAATGPDVRIVQRARWHADGSLDVTLIPVVSIRVGKIAGYEWDLRGVGERVGRRRVIELIDLRSGVADLSPSGLWPVSLTVTNEAEKSFFATTIVDGRSPLRAGAEDGPAR